MQKITALTILAVACAFGSTNACGSCPLSWLSLGHTCVKLFYEFKLTFDQAENACNAFRVNDCDGTVLSAGHLVSIQSQEQQDVLVELIQRTLSAEVGAGWDPQVYIGMSVGNTSSHESWTDGLDVDFTSWFPGEPNLAPYSRGVIAAGRYSGGNWADVHTSSHFSYICEILCFENDVNS